MKPIVEITREIAKLARERQLVKNSLAPDDVKTKLLAQLDEAERSLYAEPFLKTDSASKSGKA